MVDAEDIEIKKKDGIAEDVEVGNPIAPPEGQQLIDPNAGAMTQGPPMDQGAPMMMAPQGYMPVAPVHVALDAPFVANEEMMAAQAKLFGGSKNAYQNGHLSVQLDRAFYFPGDTVNGRVFIQSVAITPCSYVKLEVEGKEKAEYTRFWTEYEDRTRMVTNDQGQQVEEHYQAAVERSERLKKKLVAMSFEVPIMDMSHMDNFIQAGNYTALFAFKLPDKISSTLKYEDKGSREHPEAKVEHKIKISLQGTGLKDKPKAKAEIEVRQRPVQGVELNKQIKSEITKYYCYNAGVVETQIAFKDCFYDMNETAQCKFTVDNSQCTIDVGEIQYQFRHNFQIKIKGHTYVIEKDIAHDHMKGLEAGKKDEFEGKIHLDKCKYLFPSNDSKIIKSFHYQIVKLRYDSCCICEEMPSLSLPTTIIANKFMPMFKGFIPPPGPPCTDLGFFNLEVRNYVVDSD